MSTGHRRDYGTLDRWLNAIVYYGLGQQFLLGPPVVWLVWQHPPVGPEAASAMLVAMATVAVSIGLFRLGALPDGRPWPALSNAKLGTGDAGGYRSFLRRLVTLSATLSVAVVGGVLVQLATGSVGVKLVVAAGLAAGGIALIPSLDGDSLGAGGARVGYHTLGLVALAWLARPHDLGVGVTSAPLAFGFLVACAAVDALPVLRHFRERLL